MEEINPITPNPLHETSSPSPGGMIPSSESTVAAPNSLNALHSVWAQQGPQGQNLYDTFTRTFGMQIIADSQRENAKIKESMKKMREDNK